MTIDDASNGEAADALAPSPPPVEVSPHAASTAPASPRNTSPTLSENTRRAYAEDWKHFSGWCRRQNASATPPDAVLVAGYLAACADGKADGTGKASSLATIKRRLASLVWGFCQRGMTLDRSDPSIGSILRVVADRGTKPERKAALIARDVVAMAETLDRGTLRGMRDRAMLLLGFAAGLRRSEITGLDLGPGHSKDGTGWVELTDKGLRLTLSGMTATRTIDINPGASDATCPVAAVKTWVSFARLSKGPLFRRVTGKGRQLGADRLHDQEVARLVKRTAKAAGLGADLEGDLTFSSRSLRVGKTNAGRQGA